MAKIVLSRQDVYNTQKELVNMLKENNLLPKASSNLDDGYDERKTIIEAFWETKNNTRFVPYRTAENPNVYPTIDDVPTDWDTWDKELERLKKSPFSVSKRLGVTTTKPPGVSSRSWNQLSANITSIVGPRPGGSSNYQKDLKRAGDTVIDRSSVIYDESITTDKLVDFAAGIIGPAVDNSEIVLGGNKVIVGIDFANGVLIVTVKPISEKDTTKFQRGTKTFEITPRKDKNLSKNQIENLIQFTPKTLQDVDLGKYYYDIGHGDSYGAGLLRTLIAETRENEQTAQKDPELGTEEKNYLISVFKAQRKELEEELRYLNDKDAGDFAFKYNGKEVADLYGVPLTREENLYITRQLVDKSSAYLKVISIVDQEDGTRSITVTEDTTIIPNFKSDQYRIQFDSYNRSSAKFGRIVLNRLDKIMRRPRSPPPTAKLLIATLLEIFQGKAEAQKYLSRNKSKRRKILKTIRLTKNRPKKLNVRTRRGTVDNRRKVKNKKPKKWFVRSQDETQNIVPILNAELKRYVLEQMSYPSLENRSGRFASSVRVLSAQEDAAVQYTYQKSPYQVFSQTRGKSPWNDRQERDPAQIIDKAIKRIGMDKFGKVFRTEER